MKMAKHERFELIIKESTIISHTLLLIDVVTVCWHLLCSVLTMCTGKPALYKGVAFHTVAKCASHE